jgi:CubicO group peptidase (beta-lactamase class C family)
MTDTTMTPTDAQKKRLAAGNNPMLRPIRNWHFDALAGAGALLSTGRDMLKFLTAAMGLRETPLRRAFDLMLEKKHPTGTPDLDVAMGWHIWTKYGTEIVWHNGGTGGYRSFAGFDPKTKTGVVVLCNTSFGVDDLGLHALEPKWPVAKFRLPVERKPVAVDENVLEGYVGEYELRPGFTITVTRSAAKLFMQATGQVMFEYLAASATEFFRTAGDIRVTFLKDPSGAVKGLMLYQDGFDREAKKIK